MRAIIETEPPSPRSNPVDVVELVAAARDWRFERANDDEIQVAVTGQCADYAASFAWVEACEALHLGCAFVLPVPSSRELETLRLLCRVNEQLLVGHFDLWPTEEAIMFRHSLLLSGGAAASGEQAERMLAAALETCERYHQAFRFVVDGGRSAKDALACCLFETVGNA